MDLKNLGWNSTLQEQFNIFEAEGYSCGRVAIGHKSNLYKVFTEAGELLAAISGKFRYQSSSSGDLPTVGDWVVIKVRPNENKALIHSVLPRKSKFSRKVAGNSTEEQVIATNIDTVFLVNSLNNDFQIRRIERYLIMTWESGANPVIILSKADLCGHVPEKVSQVEAIAPGVPIHVLSSVNNEGLASLSTYFKEGHTVALLGSSGVGKSTLINTLIGADIQRVNDVREGDDRGKHTTTHRELIFMPKGGLIIDTPGMRELQLWEADEGINHAFEDIELLSKQCFFNDCQHLKEHGCAVQLALKEGRLEVKRYQSFRSLGWELANLSQKMLTTIRKVENDKGKKFAKQIIKKERGKKHANFRKGLTKGR